MKLKKNVDKLGVIGILIVVLLSPCCFPLFAVGASVFGLGTFELFGGWTMWLFQAMVVISIIGFIFSYKNHRSLFPLFIAVPSALFIFYGYHLNTSVNWIYFLYTGMIGLLIATGVNYYQNKRYGFCQTCISIDGKNIELLSTLTCPNCGFKKNEMMPTDACMYFYECENCKKVLKPLKGDCCVFCSYGTVVCPPLQ